MHVQYSTNAGITWYTLRTLNFDTDYGVTQYVVLDVPEAARTNETRVRWRQVSDDGAYLEDWALDQVCPAFHGYIKYLLCDKQLEGAETYERNCPIL